MTFVSTKLYILSSLRSSSFLEVNCEKKFFVKPNVMSAWLTLNFPQNQSGRACNEKRKWKTSKIFHETVNKTTGYNRKISGLHDTTWDSVRHNWSKQPDPLK